VTVSISIKQTADGELRILTRAWNIRAEKWISRRCIGLPVYWNWLLATWRTCIEVCEDIRAVERYGL
jgi:hypothetical protein